MSFRGIDGPNNSPCSQITQKVVSLNETLAYFRDTEFPDVLVVSFFDVLLLQNGDGGIPVIFLLREGNMGQIPLGWDVGSIGQEESMCDFVPDVALSEVFEVLVLAWLEATLVDFERRPEQVAFEVDVLDALVGVLDGQEAINVVQRRVWPHFLVLRRASIELDFEIQNGIWDQMVVLVFDSHHGLVDRGFGVGVARLD